VKETNIPQHVAIIPDGNRRWAKSKGLKASYGYVKSGEYEHLKSLILESRKLGVKYLSLWAFSTENWSRPEKEREILFKLILDVIDKFKKDALKDKIRLRFIGRRERLPKEMSSKLLRLEKETKNFNSFTIVLCLDYGGRDEILRVVNKIIKSRIKRVDEKKFSKLLDTSGIPDVDLIIRTAGEKRTSGFMPFQSIYSELYFAEPCFPDFNRKELKKAIKDFEKRKRNFGK